MTFKLEQIVTDLCRYIAWLFGIKHA